MPLIEILLLILMFVFSLWLIRANFEASLVLLLILSVLLHKEFFSIYRWDLLPVRVFMLAFLANVGWDGWLFYKKEGTKGLKARARALLSESFVQVLSALWLVWLASLAFTQNFTASALYFGFLTTVAVLGVVLYARLRDQPEKVLNLIKTYIYVLFGLTIFGFTQLFVYLKTEFIFGALWNVHGRTPRIGATFWDVNHFGALLASLLPILGMFILAARKWKERLWYIFLFIPMSAMLLLTNSRSAWILAGVAFLSFTLIMLVKKWGAKGVYTLLLVLALISGGALLEYNDKASPFRKVVKDYFHYRIDSFDSHILLLQGAFQVWEELPYLGGGVGGFFEHFSETDIAPVFFSRDPISLTQGFRAPGHSIWGEAMAETGGIGLFVLVLFLSILMLPLLYLAIKEKNQLKYLMGAGMFSALLGWLVAGVFYSYKSEFFWLIFFLYFLYGVAALGKKFDLNAIYSYFLKLNIWPYFVLAVIGAVLIFWRLGSNHLIPWDEAIYAKIAKNMVTSGEYIEQYWKPAQVWYEKPPLYMWMAAGAMKLFGVSEFAGRLPSALLGFLTVFIIYALGRRMFNKTAAFIAGVVLLTTTQFLYYSRASMMDVSVGFFITLALFLYYLTFVGSTEVKQKKKGRLSFEAKQRLYWVGVGLAVGMGALVKNVVGFLPLLVIGFNELYLLATKNRKLTGQLLANYLLVGFAAFAVFLPWHIEMYRRFGFAFIDNYFLYHVLERGTAAIEDKGQPFFWYLIILKVSMRIWFVALLGAFPFLLFRVTKKSKDHVFLAIWILTLFLFFSSAPSKIVWYVVPLYPVLALVVAHFAERLLDLFFHYLPRFKAPVFKSLILYSLTAFALFYLFLVKGLVYPGDATGAQAKLLQLKDATYGLELPVYVDRVDLPVILYYTDGSFVTIEFAQLRDKLSLPKYAEKVVFLTKESRFDAYAKEIPNIKLVQEIEDYALGELNSQHSRDLARLQGINDELGVLLDIVADAQVRGLAPSASTLNRVAILEVQRAQLEAEIELKLLSPESLTPAVTLENN